MLREYNMVEFRYKDENKEERTLQYDVETCTEALELWKKYLKDNNADELPISHMEKVDRNWREK